MLIKNKEVIQSYLMTTAKYDFSVYEKRILYRIIEAVQCELEGKKLYAGLKIEKTLRDDRVVMMPLSAFLNGEDDENYTRVKKALRDLRNKTFEYDNGEVWKLIGIIEKPSFEYRRGWVHFELQPEVYGAILNFTKGFRKYELKVAMSFKSQYSMRFYELMSGQKTPLIFRIDDLKKRFCVENKYARNPDFVRYVVVAAKKELDEKSPYSFDYEVIKEGRFVTALKFIPKYQPEHQDEELEKKRLQKRTSLSWDLEKPVIDYLRHGIGFTDKEIKLHRDLFIDAQSCLDDFLQDLAILRAKSRDKANPKGWIINAIRGKLDDVLKNR